MFENRFIDIISLKTRCIFNILLFIFILSLFMTPFELFSFAGGAGTAQDPYKIKTVSDLEKIPNYLNSHFIQVADIDIKEFDSNKNWHPLQNFGGVYDGNNFKIINLNINRPLESDIGLFGRVLPNAVIKNIKLENAVITGDTFVGAIAGFNNGGHIENCRIDTVTIKGNSHVGGIAGYNKGHIFRTSTSNSVFIEANTYIGGIAGKQTQGIIEQSSSAGKITKGDTWVGGISGYNTNHSQIKNSYTRVIIDFRNGDDRRKGSFIGGLVGFNDDNCSVITSHAVGNIIIHQNESDTFGGIAGKNLGYILNSYWNSEKYTSTQLTLDNNDRNENQMTFINTFSDRDWDITSTWNDTTFIWGRNDSENDGYPYLIWQSYSGPVWYVSSVDGNDSLNGSSIIFPFKTISRALEVVSPGDKIMVSSGIYNEKLVVKSDSISIIGSDSATTILNFNDTSLQTYAIGISADTIQGLKIENLQIKNYMTGIKFYNVKISNLKNITIKNTGDTGIGIHLNNSSQNSIRLSHIYNENERIHQTGILLDNNSILNGIVENRIDGFWQGVHIRNNNRANFINYNTVSNNLENGFFIENSKQHFLFDNYISNNNICGIFIINSDSTLIAHSKIENSEKGIRVETSNGSIITDNEIEETTYGMRFISSHNNRIEKNKISNPNQFRETEYGIKLSSSHNNIISEGNITTGISGYVLLNSNNNQLLKNNIFESDTCFFIKNSNNNILDSNVAKDAKSTGFYLTNSDSTQIKNSRTEYSKIYGFKIQNSDYSHFINNTITNSDSFGVYMLNSNSSQFNNNIISHSDLVGLNVSNSNLNHFINNIITYSDSVGFNLYYSNENIITNNLISNSKYGFNIYNSDTNSFSQNLNKVNSMADYVIHTDYIKQFYKNNILSDTGVINKTENTFNWQKSWWGTKSETEIITKIHNEDSNGSIIFEPYRLGMIDTGVDADITAPARPENLDLIPGSGDEVNIRVSWKSVTKNEYGEDIHNLAGYRIYRSDTYSSNGSWIQVGDVSASKTVFTDSYNLIPFENYYYKITAYDNAFPFENESFYSDVKVDSPVPSPRISISSPHNDYDTKNIIITISGTTHYTIANDRIKIFVNGNEKNDTVLQTINGEWKLPVKLSGISDVIVAKIIDRFDRTAYDTIIVNYCDTPTITILTPENNHDTKQKQITISGITEKLKGGDGQDRVQVFVNSTLALDASFPVSRTGEWTINNVPFQGRGDTVYMVLTDRFGRKIKSDSIIVNYYAPATISILSPATNYETSAQHISFSGESSFTTTGDKLKIFVNSVLKSEMTITANDTAWQFSNIKLTGLKDTIVVKSIDRFNRTFSSDSITVHYFVAPTVSIISPADGSFFSVDTVTVRVTSLNSYRDLDSYTVYQNNEEIKSRVLRGNEETWDFVIKLTDYGRPLPGESDTITIKLTNRFGENFYDTINVTFNNNPPIAIINDTITEMTIFSGEEITLTGENSYEPDGTGTIDTYVWFIYSSGENIYSETITYIPTFAGYDTIGLRVYDNYNYISDTEYLSITVRIPETKIKTEVTGARPDIDYYTVAFHTSDDKASYNDFVADLNIEKVINDELNLDKIIITSKALCRGTKDVNSFRINLNVNGTADITITEYRPDGSLARPVVDISGRRDFLDFALFQNTRESFFPVTPLDMAGPNHESFNTEGNFVIAEITLRDPVSNPATESEKAPYTPYLVLTNGDTVGTWTFDGHGYPNAVIVPTNWNWTKGSRPITESVREKYYTDLIPRKDRVAYPLFDRWVESNFKSYVNWFEKYDENNVVHNTRPFRELQNQKNIHGNNEAYLDDIVSLKIEITNKENKVIHNPRVKLYLPEGVIFHSIGNDYNNPTFVPGVDYRIQYFVLDKIPADTIYMYVNLKVENNDIFADKEIIIFAELLVDTLLVNTSEATSLKLIKELPAAPQNLRFTDYKDGSGLLEWNKPLTTQKTKQYNIYFISENQNFDFNNPFDTVPANKLYYEFNNLTEPVYKAIVRTLNDFEIEDNNNNEIIIRLSNRKPQGVPEIKIVSPLRNQKISGNNFKFIADVNDKVTRKFESTKVSREYIKNIVKNNPREKGNRSDYITFEDDFQKTQVKVWTTEINPYLILDDNFITVENENSKNNWQFRFDRLTDNGYLWIAEIPLLSYNDTVHIKLSGSRIKDYKDLNITAGFELVYADNSVEHIGSVKGYPWENNFNIINKPQGRYSLRLVISNENSGDSFIADEIPFEIDHLNWNRKDDVIGTGNKTRRHTIVRLSENKDINIRFSAPQQSLSGSSLQGSLSRTSSQDSFNRSASHQILHRSGSQRNLNQSASENSISNTSNSPSANSDKIHSLSINVPANFVNSDSYTNNLKFHIIERKRDDDLYGENDDYLIDALRNFDRLQASSIFEMKLIDGNTVYNSFNNSIEIEINYFDENNDGFVDDINIRERDLNLIHYSTKTNYSWRNLTIDTINDLNKTVTGTTNHSGLIMLASPTPEKTANYVVVYPNPFVPNDGNDDNGINYIPGIQNSGIIFDNLPYWTTIRIYTVRGSLVTERVLNNNQSRRYQWDVLNDNGYDVASGVYLFVISSPSGTRTGKFVIIR